jgi:hypothetical protein
MARTVGLVTIGRARAPTWSDDLGEADVLGLAPGPGDEVLVSRLRTGREVRLSRRPLEPRAQSCLDRLQRDADLSVLLCTGGSPSCIRAGWC